MTAAMFLAEEADRLWQGKRSDTPSWDKLLRCCSRINVERQYGSVEETKGSSARIKVTIVLFCNGEPWWRCKGMKSGPERATECQEESARRRCFFVMTDELRISSLFGLGGGATHREIGKLLYKGY